MPTITLQQFLIVALPIGLPAMGSMLAAVLAQDGFDKLSPYINPVIAYVCLLAFALLSAYAEGQLTADVSGLIAVCTFIFSLGVSGGLHALSPWMKWLNLLQTYFFAIVKAEKATYVQPLMQPHITEQPTLQTATVSTAMQPGTQSHVDTTSVKPLSISQYPTASMPIIPDYPSAQLPAVNPGDLPTLTFELAQP